MQTPFNQTMQNILSDDTGTIAVAVSGGGDSMALLHLMARYAAGRVAALTVDHGLRAGAKAEAQMVADYCAAQKIPHRILTWDGDKPQNGIQEHARNARYALLLSAARDMGAGVLALAHNREDQIETFWMRLSHGSGVDGLAAMAQSRMAGAVRIIRPLLSVSRDELRDYCAAEKIPYADDPSNVDGKYLRVRLRGFADMLTREGFTPDRLLQTIEKFAAARDTLAFATSQAADICVAFHPAGFATLDKTAWAQYPDDLRQRVVVDILQSVAPADYPPSFTAVERLCADIAGGDFTGVTLAGCDIFKDKTGAVIFVREAAQVAPPQICDRTEMIWDRRFVIRCDQAARDSGCHIAALGEEGLRLLRKKAATDAALARQLDAFPFKIKRVIPALFRGERLLAAPHMHYAAPDAGATVDIIFHRL